jgi:hypothetical protein
MIIEIGFIITLVGFGMLSYAIANKLDVFVYDRNL